MVPLNAFEVSPTVEETALGLLRERILDIITLDEKFGCNFYLLQWLKAQSMNPERSEDMIRKAYKWHQEQKQLRKIDLKTFLDWKARYGWVYGLGKNRRPVVYYKIGPKDFKAGISKYGKRTWVQLWTKYFAELDSLMFVYNKNKNRNTKRITYQSTTEVIMIIDIKGSSARQLTSLDVVSACVEVVSNGVTYFPATAGLAVFMNMNRVFKVILAAVKPLLSLPYFTLEVCGDEKDWKDKILRLMDEDQLMQMLSRS